VRYRWARSVSNVELNALEVAPAPSSWSHFSYMPTHDILGSCLSLTYNGKKPAKSAGAKSIA
jgi:hypothetical protein